MIGFIAGKPFFLGEKGIFPHPFRKRTYVKGNKKGKKKGLDKSPKT